MITPVIRGQSPEAIAEAAKKVEDFAAKTPWFKQKVHHASSMIVSGGKLSNYGGKEAQAYLKKWSKEFAPKEEYKPARDKKPEPDKTKATET